MTQQPPPTHLYGYQLEDLNLHTYVWISERAQSENHPDLPIIRRHIHFDSCPYCTYNSTMSFDELKVTRFIGKHIIKRHPHKAFSNWFVTSALKRAGAL